MLKTLSVAGFKAVPYLETSALMKRAGGKLKFSSSKPNVIVGPNGAGKTALMETLALRFLAQLTGESCLDGKYISGHDSEPLWSCTASWRNDWAFLKGLEVVTDNAPARYYRPNHVPGNETSITHAMMCGYFEQAKAFGALTKDKSSGQQSQALQRSLLKTLAGEELPRTYPLLNWSGGREPRELRGHFTTSYDHQAEALKALFAKVDGGVPLVLMDEPEQSLDAKAELQLWQAISRADCSQMQIVVATHSLYPLLHRKKFNLIEAVDGYVDEVLALVA